MIKQLEMPWQSRALIVLDPRQAGHATPESFEHMVRGAASALRHLFSNGYTPTLWSGAGPGTVVGSGDTYTIGMEELASVQPAVGIDLRAAIGRMRRDGMAGGVLVICTGVPDEADLGAFRLLGRDFYRTLVMSVADQKTEVILRFARAGATTIVVRPTERWAPVWKDSMEAAWSTASAG